MVQLMTAAREIRMFHGGDSRKKSRVRSTAGTRWKPMSGVITHNGIIRSAALQPRKSRED